MTLWKDALKWLLWLFGMWGDSLTCGTYVTISHVAHIWLFDMWDIYVTLWNDSLKWLFEINLMTLGYVGHISRFDMWDIYGSLTCGTYMTLWHVGHIYDRYSTYQKNYIYVDIPHTYIDIPHIKRVIVCLSMYIWLYVDIPHIYIDIPHIKIWGISSTYFDMGWLRWVGCLKIQVSLQNTILFCRALLQKRPIFLSTLLIVATPYVEFDMWNIFHIFWSDVFWYGVATISRMLKNTGLFAEYRSLL